MTITSFLGLSSTSEGEGATTTFLSWRLLQDGISSSNASIIDAWASETSGSVTATDALASETSGSVIAINAALAGLANVAIKNIWIGNAKPTLTAGCDAQAQIEMGTNKNVYDYLAFDASTIEYAYANVVMPSNYDGGTITATFYWTHPATTTNFKVAWGIQAISISDNYTLDVAQGTVQYANDTGTTTNDLYVSPATSAITIGGPTPAAGELVQFRIQRRADDATNDTLAVDAYLLGVQITYTDNYS